MFCNFSLCVIFASVSTHCVVVGVASAVDPHGQNIGYLIPVSILHLFLNEVESSGTWAGVSESGLYVMTLESDSYRLFLGMEPNMTGVQVHTVAPLSALFGQILRGDIVTHIDGRPVSNEGKVPVYLSGQTVHVDASAIFTCKPKGQQTTFSILRQSSSLQEGSKETLQKKTVSAVLRPISPLAPRFHGFDSKPEYVVLGGLVFCRATVPILQKFSIWYHVVDRALDTYKQTEDEELVVLLKILPHDINVGFSCTMEIVEIVDDIEIKNLKQLARIAKSMNDGNSSGSDFVKVILAEQPKTGTTRNTNRDDSNSAAIYPSSSSASTTDGGPESQRPHMTPQGDVRRFPSVVLKRSDIPEATADLCQSYGVTHSISPSLLED